MPEQRPYAGVPLSTALVFTAIPSLLPAGPQNPLIPVSPRDILRDLERMESHPTALARPVLVLGGWRSPAFVMRAFTHRLVRCTSGRHEDYLCLSYPLRTRLGEIARHVVEQVQERWPAEGDAQTVEVDVVAHSMGGLVARLAALPGGAEGRRLAARRVFTLGTPHRGARLARLPAVDGAVRDMRAGSDLLERLDDGLRRCEFELVCYAHLRDKMVGATRCAPPGREPIWTGGTRIFSHFSVLTDTIIRADIGRRLRGETPVAQGPSTPPRD